jgi:putative ATP-dependent endonuclease of the OLD family
MRIVSISISRFRSIIDAESIDLGNLTILIGKNNEGKSNIIKALTLALESIEYYGLMGSRGNALVRPRSYDWNRDFPVQLRSDDQKNKKSRFRIDFKLSDAELEEFRAEIKSNLNYILPVEIQIGSDNRVDFRVLKPGRGASTFEKKSRQVATFLSERISIDHIPAVRTESDALSVINSLLRRPLRAIETLPEYKQAVDKIRELQKPVLDQIANEISIGLKKYIPAIKAVQIDTSLGRLYRGLTSEIDLLIDDGAPTSIEFKGDGIKSLVALSLAQRSTGDKKTHVVAIEEPESHLHPGAVHELRQVVSELSTTGQVIVSTHNPIFVDRNRLVTTVLVEGGKARRAKDVEAIRAALGVRVADNLGSAEFCVVVEGPTDAIVLSKLLSEMSPHLAKLISKNWIVFEPLNGASKLDYKLGLIRHAMSAFHVILDNDAAGRAAVDKAIEKAQLGQAEYNLLSVRGTAEAELEDCINIANVSAQLSAAFGGVWDRLPGKGKWSERFAGALQSAGKRPNSESERLAKQIYADAIVRDGETALTGIGRTLVHNIVQALEPKVVHLEQS